MSTPDAAPPYEPVEELLEAIRLTQEYAQLPCIEGWTWYDTYRKYRPEDAERLRAYWQQGVDNGAWEPTSNADEGQAGR